VGPTCRREKERKRVPVRVRLDGPRAGFFPGPNRFPGVQNIFIWLKLFSFSFLDFYLSFENAPSFRFE
jgi:hypothetical protein